MSVRTMLLSEPLLGSTFAFRFVQVLGRNNFNNSNIHSMFAMCQHLTPLHVLSSIITSMLLREA